MAVLLTWPFSGEHQWPADAAGLWMAAAHFLLGILKHNTGASGWNAKMVVWAESGGHWNNHA